MSNFKYEIVERIAILSESSAGWTKELIKISWNERPAKYDLRDWNHDKGKMGKGLTFATEELENLREVLNSIDL